MNVEQGKKGWLGGFMLCNVGRREVKCIVVIEKEN